MADDSSGQASVLVAVAAGGAVGASARYGLALLWPTPPDAFPWTTLLINVTGCAAMGVLMVLVTGEWPVHRLLRPFAGTGVLGGYTTFSLYAADGYRLISGHQVLTGLAYLLLTVVAALAAVWASAAATRRLLDGRAR